MKPILAGLTAWIIEFSIVLTFLCIIKREEKKVYRRRNG
tara:strand:- start:10849 stop:10965 length:117 start_codon:yes stop_codon:yes gene_type:complete